MKNPECPVCGSENTAETRTDAIFRCFDCDEYFEGDDFELLLIEEKRSRRFKKESV